MANTFSSAEIVQVRISPSIVKDALYFVIAAFQAYLVKDLSFQKYIDYIFVEIVWLVRIVQHWKSKWFCSKVISFIKYFKNISISILRRRKKSRLAVWDILAVVSHFTTIIFCYIKQLTSISTTTFWFDEGICVREE